MLGPLDIDLAKFGVSERYGFLPEGPLEQLSEPYVCWEELISDLPRHIKERTIREQVAKLPVLAASNLKFEKEWQRAYVVLGFLTHAHIWGGETPAEVLPAAIAVPFTEVACHLGLPPTATYACLNLWNFYSTSPDLTNLNNLSIPHTFTGTVDEEWFYLISVAIEAQGALIIPDTLRCMNAVRANDVEAVTQSLTKLADCIQEIETLFERMHERCDPEVFYHRIRPFLAGSKNMSAAGLPRGVKYKMEIGEGEWRQYSGGSNAQSSLIQFFDVVLGVEHAPTRGSDSKAAGTGKNGFLEEMREYMPGGHRAFLERLDEIANIREFISSSSAANEESTAAYNRAIECLATFRTAHIQLVTRYIVIPSRKAAEGPGDGLNIAVGSANKESASLAGTGGTQLLPFLKQSRDETSEGVLS